MKKTILSILTATALLGCKGADAPSKTSEAVQKASGPELCQGMGPQTPRDISSVTGLNLDDFPMAPSYREMNLCNIHTHTNAEHKGPGFSVFVNDSDHGGYACNDTGSLTEAELQMPEGEMAFGHVKTGDTIEVHWVHTSCDITPGEGLGSCLNDACTDPLLRVEAQTFLVVNDANAANFLDFDYPGRKKGNFHQAKTLPGGTGQPVVFRGSTTGPSYTQNRAFIAYSVVHLSEPTYKPRQLRKDRAQHQRPMWNRPLRMAFARFFYWRHCVCVIAE